MKNLKQLTFFLYFVINCNIFGVSVLIDNFSQIDSSNEFPLSGSSSDMIPAGINRSVNAGPTGSVVFTESSSDAGSYSKIEFQNSTVESTLSYQLPNLLSISITPFINISFGNATCTTSPDFETNNLVARVDLSTHSNNYSSQNIPIPANAILSFDSTTFTDELNTIFNISEPVYDVSFTFQNLNSPNTFTFDVNRLTLDSVPEPFSMITLGTGVAAFIRKRKKIALTQ